MTLHPIPNMAADTNISTETIFNHTSQTITEAETDKIISTMKDKEEDLGQTVFRNTWIYVGPIVFLLGFIGNILTILVMRRKRLRGSTACVYLPLLAIADLLVLTIGMIPEWLEAKEVVIFKKIHPATCKFEKFTFYTFGDVAIWILVAFTLDRFVAVCFPLKKSKICVPKRAFIFAGILLICAVTKNFHVLWTRGAEIKEKDGEIVTNNCGRPTPSYKYFSYYIRPWIAFTLVSLVPFLLILIFNISIVTTLIRMQSLTYTGSVNKSEGHVAKRRFSQTTIMCLAVSLLFLVTITPSMVLLIGRPYWDVNGNDAYEIAKAIGNMVVYLNHSLNFFLYCMTGRRFREELVAMVKRQPSGPMTRSLASGLYNIHKISVLKDYNVDVTATKGHGNGTALSEDAYSHV